MTVAPHRNGQLSRRVALRRVGLAAGGIGILAVLEACGGEREPDQEPAPNPAAPAAADPGVYVVEMSGQMRFVPDTLTIKVGETVTWITRGAIPHTTTADPAKAREPAYVRLPEGAEPWDSGLLTSGESWSRTFDVPGEYAYFCLPHQSAGMLATLTVTE